MGDMYKNVQGKFCNKLYLRLPESVSVSSQRVSKSINITKRKRKIVRDRNMRGRRQREKREEKREKERKVRSR